jgi:hypothetical protein
MELKPELVRIGASWSVLFTHYCAGDKVEKNEMGGACSADVEGRRVYRVLWENLRERGPWEDTDLDGKIILRWIFRKWDEVWTGFSWLGIETGGGNL